MRIQIHPHLISSPNRGKNSAGGFISFRFLCGKLHHLFIFWPLNAAANAKSFSIFERNYKFPFYLMSCKPWFGKISVENESRIIWFRTRGLKEEIGLWQLWNMLEIFQFRWIGVACEELGPNRWEKGVWQIKSKAAKPKLHILAWMYVHCTWEIQRCKEAFVAPENEGCLKGELEGQNVARSNIRQGLSLGTTNTGNREKGEK